MAALLAFFNLGVFIWCLVFFWTERKLSLIGFAIVVVYLLVLAYCKVVDEKGIELSSGTLLLVHFPFVTS